MSKYEYQKITTDKWRAVIAKENTDLTTLPPGLYNLVVPEDNGQYYYHKQDKPYDVPKALGTKANLLIGSIKEFIPGINNNVYLHGTKGTGKSLSAYHAMNDLSKTMPVISINAYLSVEDLENSVLDDIKPPFVLFVDEVDDKFQDFTKERKVSDLAGVWGNPKYHGVKWIVTGNDEPCLEVKGRPNRVRLCIDMATIAQDSMMSILDSRRNNIHKDVAQYLEYQIRYNYKSANSDLVHQCCILAESCKDMEDYRDKAQMVNGFDGHIDFEINNAYMRTVYNFSLDALLEKRKIVESATTMEDLLSAKLVTVSSSASGDKEPKTFKDLADNLKRMMDGMVSVKSSQTWAKPNLRASD